MSRTVWREAGFRLYFFSREEARPHVHVQHADGEAKFWLEPEIELANNEGLSDRTVRFALRLEKQRSEELRDAWYRHFGQG